MEKQIQNKPILKITRWTFFLISILLLLTLLFNYLVIHPWPPVHSEKEIGNALFIIIIISTLRFIIIITSVVLAIKSIIKKERKWIVFIELFIIILTGIAILSSH